MEARDGLQWIMKKHNFPERPVCNIWVKSLSQINRTEELASQIGASGCVQVILKWRYQSYAADLLEVLLDGDEGGQGAQELHLLVVRREVDKILQQQHYPPPPLPPGKPSCRVAVHARVV